MDFPALVILARKEFGDFLRTRWFAVFAGAFTLLALGLSYLATSFSGLAGLQGYGRTAAGLVNLVLLIVPLMGLTAGAQTLAGERERGTLLYLLAQPIDRAEVFAGKFLGLAGGLLTSLLLAFGLTGLLLALGGSGFDGRGYLLFAGLTLLLLLASLALGMAISAWAPRLATAMGAVLFAWLGLVFLGDLGLMGATVGMRLGIRFLFGLSLLNPLQLFKAAAVSAMEPTMEVVGPVGLYARDLLGARLGLAMAGGLALWGVCALIAAYLSFRRRDVR